MVIPFLSDITFLYFLKTSKKEYRNITLGRNGLDYLD